MPNKMLIDASHREETRVVVTRGNRIEEFDFESQDKKQLKGNIYLARVTRVEPSLQAAFVEYGGNRHGFLAFSEIHPDYYQIPVADRQALLRADAEAAEAEEEEEEAEERGRNRRRGRGGRNRRRGSAEERGRAETRDEAPGGQENESNSGEDATVAADFDDANTVDAEASGPTMAARTEADVVSERIPHDDEAANGNGEEGIPSAADEEVESVGAEDALEEVPNRRKQVRRQYKIQEVIKRRQILLVQVVKEERGNKGAALTTYLSLAGRYSVLMPNTARGGGISRKITSAQDRKRLKEVVSDLEVPEGMGVILRTAGANRTKAEIKRDYEYLMRLWENVRNLTLQSTAPALVYEEGSLIKRSVRDLYNKDIDEILVAGEDGYREAKDFMRMLMPSHAKMVQPYRDNVPIFARNGIEAQLDRMLQPQVTLKSGGYIIINQTEALVSIDVNSGRSTKEHSIEDTALQTNLEAAEEVARQLRLRDLAGLIVIDFIDMEENRNNRSVEKRLKDHLKHDRARIQVGRISHFGLLEMSRQRIRASVLESTMKPCPHCGGTGHVRSDSSVALHVVRGIEEFLLKDARNHIAVRTPAPTALYVLNHKRDNLVELESRFGLTITIEADDTVGSQHFIIARGLPVERPIAQPASPMDAAPPEAEVEIEPEVELDEEEDETPAAREDAGSGEGEGRRKRRRRRRRGGRDREAATEGERAHTAVSTTAGDDIASADEEEESEADSADSGVRAEASDEGGRKKRRRGKRGGKRNRREDGTETGDPEQSGEAEEVQGMGAAEPDQPESPAEAETVSEAVAEAPAVSDKPKRARRAPKRAAVAEEVATAAEDAGQSEAPAQQPLQAATEPTPAASESTDQEPAPKQRPSRRKPAAEQAAPARPVVVSSVPEPVDAEAEVDAKPRKAGWWQRKGFF